MIDFLATYAGMIGLLFFFAFFVLVVVRVYRPSKKGDYQSCADIPLKEIGNE